MIEFDIEEYLGVLRTAGGEEAVKEGKKVLLHIQQTGAPPKPKLPKGWKAPGLPDDDEPTMGASYGSGRSGTKSAGSGGGSGALGFRWKEGEKVVKEVGVCGLKCAITLAIPPTPNYGAFAACIATCMGAKK